MDLAADITESRLSTVITEPQAPLPGMVGMTILWVPQTEWVKLTVISLATLLMGRVFQALDGINDFREVGQEQIIPQHRGLDALE